VLKFLAREIRQEKEIKDTNRKERVKKKKLPVDNTTEEVKVCYSENYKILKKLKKTLQDGKTFQVHESPELIL
jgi:hypothetical protein